MSALLLNILQYATFSIRNSPACLTYVFQFGVLMVTVAAHQSLLLCVYQGIVMVTPFRYFRWRKSITFRRAWISILTVDWLFCIIVTYFSPYFRVYYHSTCYAYVRVLEEDNEELKIALYTKLTILNLFLPQLVQALLYIFYFLHSLCKRRAEGLTKEQKKMIRVQGQIAAVGFLSFAVTFTVQCVNAFFPAVLEKNHVIRIGLLYIDRAGDPLWHYWRNSVFRAQINGMFTKSTKVVSTNISSQVKTKP